EYTKAVAQLKQWVDGSQADGVPHLLASLPLLVAKQQFARALQPVLKWLAKSPLLSSNADERKCMRELRDCLLEKLQWNFERVDIMVDKVSQVKIPWTSGTSIGDSFRNSELTLTNHKRQQAVRNAMQHAWTGYKTHAFGEDELQPISKGGNVRWGDWAISLVDSLDTLKLMEMEEEYLEAKEFVRSMDFGRVTPGYMTQVFEMTIRALGGLLGAYELDEDPMLLKKAREVADILAVAFEGSLVGLPVSYVDVNMKKPVPAARVCIAEAGTIQLEFKKLSQLTGDPKYRKIAERASDVLETATKYHSGLYPMYLNTVNGQYDHSASLSMGAGADSFYEYQLKQYILHDKAEEKYKD
ncbi:hypothetical protein GGF37_005846, partial [Kickxella alabastrina]